MLPSLNPSHGHAGLETLDSFALQQIKRYVTLNNINFTVMCDFCLTED